MSQGYALPILGDAVKIKSVPGWQEISIPFYPLILSIIFIAVVMLNYDIDPMIVSSLVLTSAAILLTLNFSLPTLLIPVEIILGIIGARYL
ncbi:MAG: hypothetical protein H8Z69_03500 [Nanohaloarchaea archaeon]|nr:hypothetical protein [Candidatus Nanohaloarchaea archaeon]